ncbi:MAG: hypothetical protein IT442_04275 [Phycisphaeraceae bacterium]|nr:hypothetical protein [Phycisphaeraceae bacterium]
MSSTPTFMPPTVPNLASPAPQSSWPTVLGVIGLVLGILGGLGYLCGALWPLIAPWMQQHMPADAASDIPPTPVISIVIAIVSLILSILLCVAATRLLQRRLAAVKLWRTWAWLKIVALIVGMALSIPIQIEAMRQAAAGQTTQPSPMSEQTLTIIAVGGAALGLVVFLILPVFALIWFNREKIRQETALWP